MQHSFVTVKVEGYSSALPIYLDTSRLTILYKPLVHDATAECEGTASNLASKGPARTTALWSKISDSALYLPQTWLEFKCALASVN